MRKWAMLALLAFGQDGCVPLCEDCGGGYYEPSETGGYGDRDRHRDHDRDRDRGGHRDGGGRHGDGDRGGHHGDGHRGDRDHDRN